MKKKYMHNLIESVRSFELDIAELYSMTSAKIVHRGQLCDLIMEELQEYINHGEWIHNGVLSETIKEGFVVVDEVVKVGRTTITFVLRKPTEENEELNKRKVNCTLGELNIFMED